MADSTATCGDSTNRARHARIALRVLGEALAGDLHAAVLADHDRAVGLDQVIARDGLRARRKLHCNDRAAEDLAEFFRDERPGLVHRAARKMDRATAGAEQNIACGVNLAPVGRGLIVLAVGRHNLQRVEGLNAIVALRDGLEHGDVDDIGQVDPFRRWHGLGGHFRQHARTGSHPGEERRNQQQCEGLFLTSHGDCLQPFGRFKDTRPAALRSAPALYPARPAAGLLLPTVRLLLGG